MINIAESPSDHDLIIQVQAAVTSEPERTELYEKMESIFATFTEGKEKAGRVIPVLRLSRLS